MTVVNNILATQIAAMANGGLSASQTLVSCAPTVGADISGFGIVEPPVVDFSPDSSAPSLHRSRAFGSVAPPIAIAPPARVVIVPVADHVIVPADATVSRLVEFPSYATLAKQNPAAILQEFRVLRDQKRIEAFGGVLTLLQKWDEEKPGNFDRLNEEVQQAWARFQTLRDVSRSGVEGAPSVEEVGEAFAEAQRLEALLYRGLTTGHFSLQGDIQRAIAKLLRTYQTLTQKEHDLLSWVVQEAVFQSETNLKRFYSLLHLAAREFRASVSQDEALLQKLLERPIGLRKGTRGWPATFSVNRQNLQWLTNAVSDRSLLRANMSLPAEQKDWGAYYDVDADLQRLGLDQLRGSFPDRIPIPPRSDAPEDSNYSNYPDAIRMYDIGLRVDMVFSKRGEVLPTDETVNIMTHGVGSSRSTTASLLSWQQSLMDNPRKTSAIVVGWPWHGFGPRDLRFKTPLANPVELSYGGKVPTRFGAADTESLFEWLDTLKERYLGYRGPERALPIGLGGRSTGGAYPFVHRLSRSFNLDGQGRPYPDDRRAKAFDFYFNMNGYSVHPLLLWWDEFAVTRVSDVQVNRLGIDWAVAIDWGLIGLFAAAEVRARDSSFPPLLNMIAGKDLGYPHRIPESLDPDSPEGIAFRADWIGRMQTVFSGKFAKINDRQILAAEQAQLWDELSRRFLFGFQDYLAEFLGLPRPMRGQFFNDDDYQSALAVYLRSVDGYWQKVRAVTQTHEDYWKSDTERDPRARLLFLPNAEHDMASTEQVRDKPQTFRLAMAAMRDFLDGVITD